MPDSQSIPGDPPSPTVSHAPSIAVSVATSVSVATPAPGESSKKRIRAVVACSYCRSKRSKCDGVPGQQPCTQCQQRGIECEMTDGKRNRGHYKPQAEALSKRVRALEAALAESHAANRQLVARLQTVTTSAGTNSTTHATNNAPQPNANDGFGGFGGYGWDRPMQIDGLPATSGFLRGMDADMQSMLLPTTAALANADTVSLAPSSTMQPPSHVFAALHTGLQQHPHAGSIVLSQSEGSTLYPLPLLHTKHMTHAQTQIQTQSSQPHTPHPLPHPQQPHLAPQPYGVDMSVPLLMTRRQPVCADLPLTPSIVDYLLGLFFHRYQLLMKFVSETFMAQHAERDAGGGPGLSWDGRQHHACCHRQNCALFLAMMAAGLRYSTRADVTDLFWRPETGENRLALAARRAVETEICRPTLATVQTVLILCEVEAALDNQMTGYMYSCLASKLIFAMGLDLKLDGRDGVQLTAEQVAIRHWLVWSASMHDQFWSVFLRRPLAIHNEALRMSRLAWRANQPAARLQGASFEEEVTEDLLDLMELVRSITNELYGPGSALGPPQGAGEGQAQAQAQSPLQPQAMPNIEELDARLNAWFAARSDRVRQGPAGGHDHFHYLFVLHLHYHATRIVMHRTRTFATQIGSGSLLPLSRRPVHADRTYATAQRPPPPSPDEAARSAQVLGDASISTAKLFESFRRREDIRSLQCTGVQWAAMAAEALTWYTDSLPIDDAIEAVAHLQSLSRTLRDMTRTFLPAAYPYDRTNNALRMFQERIDGSASSASGVGGPSFVAGSESPMSSGFNLNETASGPFDADSGVSLAGADKDVPLQHQLQNQHQLQLQQADFRELQQPNFREHQLPHQLDAAFQHDMAPLAPGISAGAIQLSWADSPWDWPIN